MPSDRPDADSTLGADGDRPPRDAGRFELLGLLGRGGMGEVLEARDRHFGRIVAVKRIAGDASAAKRERFELEAQVTGRLEHAGIPPVYERGTLADGSPYYAMKRIRGRTLSEAIADCRDLEERLRLVPAVAQVARTIAFAHDRGVLHRDVKPANIVLSEHGEVVLLDWGLAKLRLDSSGSSESDHRTVAGEVIGTPAYMAPEQAQGSIARIDVHTDVFAIGALLYHVLTGRAPYGAVGLALVEAAEGRFVPVRKLEPAVPEVLAAICERAMARDPELRPRNAAEIATQLEAAAATALVRKRGSTDHVVAALLVLLFAGGVWGTAMQLQHQAGFAGQGLGVLVAVLCAAVGGALTVIDLLTAGRAQLAEATLALALATPMFGVASVASGVSRIADQADPADPEMASSILVGIHEVSGALVTGGSLAGFQLLLWGAVRWRLARRASSSSSLAAG